MILEAEFTEQEVELAAQFNEQEHEIDADFGVLKVVNTAINANFVKTVNSIEPDKNGNVEIAIPKEVDLTGYATEEWVRDGYQPKGEYLTEHQDISGKLDASALPTAIDTALAQAKASGEFDGEDGYTPVKGKDYFDGDPGAPGTSVTVKSVSESTADGGSNVVTFSDGKTVTIKNGSKGNPGATPVKGTDYYTDADKTKMVQDAVSELSATVGIVNPDKFSGTDSQKLQSAFDALSTSGGIISINRAYTLTANIKVSHDSSAYNNLITVKGDGQNAKIDFGAYCFQGADTSKRSYGGIIFKDLWLSGTGIGYNCTHLIRLTFDNCMIRNFSNFIYCDDCVQSIYIMGCYIRASASGITNGTIKETIKTVDLCDLKIIGCVAEQGYSLLSVSGLMDGCSITDCCIEGYHSTPIVLGSKNRAVNISNNYFESNQGTHIDLTKATEWCAVSIYNNWLCEWNGMETVGAIFLPASFSSGYLTIVGNQCPYANSILLRTPDNVVDLSKVYAFANHGTTNDTKGIVKMLAPDDLNNVKVELVKGEDYWTAEDKAEMVDDVLAAMSGETWVFELADGTRFERTIATASLTEFNSETWTFTLADGSTVSKVVSVV